MDLAVFYALGIALVIVGILVIVAAIIIAFKGGRTEGQGARRRRDYDWTDSDNLWH